MRQLFTIVLWIVSSISFAQNWESGRFYDIEMRMPRIRNVENFFYTEWEFNPAEMSSKLSEVEALQKSNTRSNVNYEIHKSKQGTTSVIVRVNNRTFSEATYKNGVLDGKKTLYHANGSVFQEIEFKNGKANGAAKIYDDRYNLVMETHFKNNLKNGLRRYSYPNRDNEVLEGNYVNGNLTGNLKFTEGGSVYYLPNDLKKGKVQRFVNHKLISEFNIVNDRKIHGDAKVYNFETGAVEIKIPYYLGEKHGFMEYYNAKGELVSKYEYRFGKKVGEHKMYSKDKKLLKEEYYDEAGNKTGVWKSYTMNGDLTEEQTYQHDSLSGLSKQYKNGKTTSSVAYKNNKRHGISVYYKSDSDQKTSEVLYDTDELIKETSFYANQSVFYVQEKNKVTGLYTTKYFDKAGNLLHENNYNDKRQPVGINKYITLREDEPQITNETHFDAGGKKLKYIYQFYGGGSVETNYRNEQMHGKKITIDGKTKTETVEYYYETAGKSKKVTKEEFESLTKSEKK